MILWEKEGRNTRILRLKPPRLLVRKQLEAVRVAKAEKAVHRARQVPALAVREAEQEEKAEKAVHRARPAPALMVQEAAQVEKVAKAVHRARPAPALTVQVVAQVEKVAKAVHRARPAPAPTVQEAAQVEKEEKVVRPVLRAVLQLVQILHLIGVVEEKTSSNRSLICLSRRGVMLLFLHETNRMEVK